MVKLFILTVFLWVAVSLSGCVASVSERWAIANLCEQAIEADCTAEWDAYNSGVDAKERRQRQQNVCGRGYYLYCNHACTATRRRGEVAGVCISRTAWRF